MKTLIIKENDENGLKAAAYGLANRKLVAFPTETVYGLGANALDPEVVKKIYEVKGRPLDNPLIIHVSNISQVKELTAYLPGFAETLIRHFWPGPLTLVMKKSHKVSHEITAGLDTVGIRMPDNKTALKLIEASGVPVAAPSANLSGKPSPTSAQHVAKDFMGKIDYIIDGGICKVGVESTVLDITGEIPVILRPGGVSLEQLQKVIGRVDTAYNPLDSGNEKPRSPGMKYRHYSPKAEMYLVEGESDMVIEKINQLSLRNKQEGLKVGVLASEENASRYNADLIISIGKRDNLEEIAANLFSSLRKFDNINVDIIYSETFNETGIGRAVMNRLKKASSGRILKA
jgi:L-threonylcarbamoyladenylate synthase